MERLPDLPIQQRAISGFHQLSLEIDTATDFGVPVAFLLSVATQICPVSGSVFNVAFPSLMRNARR